MSTLQIHPIELTIPMLFLLGLCALYDLKGAEVPDACTVPYAILGICVSVLNERYTTAAIAAAVMIFILQPWRPALLTRLNRWLVRRAYHDEESEQEADEQWALKAESFEASHRRSLSLAITVGWIGSVAGALALMAGKEKHAETVLISFFALVAVTMALEFYTARQENGLDSREELSAFGGADVIALCGILGYYGVIPFVYGVAATFIVQLILMVVIRFIKKDAAPGMPLLPVVFITAPLRFYIAITFCPEVIQIFGWAMQELL